MSPLKKAKRDEILQYFRNVARQENAKHSTVSFDILLDNNGKKKFLVVCKESAGDILNVSSLLKSLKESYGDEWDIYFACDPQFHELLDCNPYIKKCLPFMDFMNSEIACTGVGTQKGFFDAYCFVPVGAQRHLTYLTHHNVILPK